MKGPRLIAALTKLLMNVCSASQRLASLNTRNARDARSTCRRDREREWIERETVDREVVGVLGAWGVIDTAVDGRGRESERERETVDREVVGVLGAWGVIDTAVDGRGRESERERESG
jgi:hypothetical protein